ncbi:Eukaryotic translation initiation factor 2A [Trachymyrmex septentrionalis]|uniref:Eukaryotic translation initiation factor 2A n=1 Tax=Trachymyrmex septentrionalis TaxID=34720 RepID=A0A195EXJ9_9HYME|nr:Eukaryotic translation initiation factor 2A [Trachymyrmex septentrionalis]
MTFRVCPLHTVPAMNVHVSASGVLWHRMTRDRLEIIRSDSVRGSNGINLAYGPPSYEPVKTFPKDDNKNCKTMLFSPDGQYFAWSNASKVKIVLCKTWQIVAEIQRPKICSLKFSSYSTYLATWEPSFVTKEEPQGSQNFHIWKSETGEHVQHFIQKRMGDWEPQWSSDETFYGILKGGNVLLYENNNFDRYVHKIGKGNIAKFSIAPGNAPYHILCYMPGSSGQPSFGRLFKYPKFEIGEAIASKSFFQADKVDMYWNQCGTNVLLMTNIEVDKTGASYYGKQTLHHLNIKGETAMVMLSKEGPIHAVEWSPRNTEFCVIYGFMPSKTTLFNCKCEAVFESGIELWDVINRKLIAKTDAPDTTLLRWSPDGEHFMTATTAPRLRITNGFKIWHYTGSLIYQRPWNNQEELWEVAWQSFPLNVFPQKPISYKAVEGIVTNDNQSQAPKEAYRPPCARGQNITFKLHDDLEVPSKSSESNPSKAALKMKKNREAKKAKKELESNNPIEHVSSTTTSIKIELTDDPEKNKKIKKITSKLDQISKLKEQLKAGKQLEINQLDKIKKEDELLKELEELTL